VTENPVRQPRRPEDFTVYYAERPPWDIGRPQPVIQAHVAEFTGAVLDIGCGTGEHALLAASLGLAATGVDTSPEAIELARAKAAERGLTARFEVANALELGALNRRFETIVDSALFHVFDDADRVRYVASLGKAIADGGRYHLLCFSDEQPGEWGPRRISEREIREAFAEWRIEVLERATFDLTNAVAQAWRAVLSLS
jgi:SAM-dependent methyltransferase